MPAGLRLHRRFGIQPFSEMYQMRRSLVLAAALLAFARPVAAQPYDPMPLLASAGLDTGQIELERQDLLAWARETPRPSPDDVPAARERVYFLIGSAVRQNLFAQRGLRPSFDMANLAQLFELGASLGVHGAAEVARGLPLREADVIGRSPPLPEGMRVEFAPPFLRVSSAAGGWRAEVPYYFMIGEVHSFRANNGLPTEVVQVSTSFTANERRPGSSQATILLVFSPSERSDEFEKFWLEQLGMGPADRATDVLRAGATTYRAYDEANDMNREAVLIRTARGPMLVAYLGLTGPFAANRPNYLDFLNHLQVP